MIKGPRSSGARPDPGVDPGAFWGDILAFVTIGAAFLFFLLRAIGQHSLYPNRDPRILESANLSN
jgi:hypothetical protein